MTFFQFTLHLHTSMFTNDNLLANPAMFAQLFGAPADDQPHEAWVPATDSRQLRAWLHQQQLPTELYTCDIEPLDAFGMCHENALQRQTADWVATLGWTVLQYCVDGELEHTWMMECHTLLLNRATGTIRDTTPDLYGHTRRAWVPQPDVTVQRLRDAGYPLVESVCNDRGMARQMWQKMLKQAGGVRECWTRRQLIRRLTAPQAQQAAAAAHFAQQEAAAAQAEAELLAMIDLEDAAKNKRKRRRKRRSKRRKAAAHLAQQAAAAARAEAELLAMLDLEDAAKNKQKRKRRKD